MGNYFKGFLVSFFVHALVALLFIGAGAGIVQNIKTDDIIDISMISIEKPEQPIEDPPAPAAPRPPPPPKLIEQPKPKPKPKPDTEPAVIPKKAET